MSVTPATQVQVTDPSLLPFKNYMNLFTAKHNKISKRFIHSGKKQMKH